MMSRQGSLLSRQSNLPATTCDSNYMDDDSCAWFTFSCSNFTVSNLTIPTCFEGTKQSPINLDPSVAVVKDPDPGYLTLQGYYSPLIQNPVLRAQGYSLQLDFDATMIQLGQEGTISQVRSLSLPMIKGGPLKNRSKMHKSINPSLIPGTSSTTQCGTGEAAVTRVLSIVLTTPSTPRSCNFSTGIPSTGTMKNQRLERKAWRP